MCGNILCQNCTDTDLTLHKTPVTGWIAARLTIWEMQLRTTRGNGKAKDGDMVKQARTSMYMHRIRECESCRLVQMRKARTRMQA